jgi:hypothetical protein
MIVGVVLFGFVVFAYRVIHEKQHTGRMENGETSDVDWEMVDEDD